LEVGWWSGVRMTLSQALEIKTGDMIVFVGAGGKTSAGNTLARELFTSGHFVILSTTTKIYPPRDPLFRLYLSVEEEGLYSNEFGSRFFMAQDQKIPVLGRKMNKEEKIIGLDPEELKAVRDIWPDAVILVEGDGAKGKPFKAPREHEPVIPDTATLVVPVIGIDAIGLPLTERYFHGVEKLCLLTGLRPGEIFQAEDAARVLLHQAGYRKGVPSAARWIPLINKLDLPEGREKALELGEMLKKAGVAKVILGSLGMENSPVEVF
jgi:probable selenium-dependent hydroxylase accessory protein YqeC